MTKRITLDGDMAVILGRLASRSGISVGAIANKVLASHAAEFYEIDTFLDAHPAGAGSLHEHGLNLVQSYGPESIIEGISRIAPDYHTLAVRFERALADAIGKTPTRS
ncbi:hypothetical protein GTP41_05495 [Pseudoduganella sp. DS3]|uniref:Uncharacterized protein n=1 Tax=Pseudoduganella guangdongensis TaxID=2692179 RepID=A0A6N9HE76_9BURK|nr:hypothetical protein [Pseudoduganella guangdongensis]MYN01547.1 hypothetical protein [Pseudoduganella guangdongensis]